MNHDDTLRRALEDAAPEGSIITNWLLVIETTDGLSNDLHVATTDGMTPWMAYGLLAAAGQIVGMSQLDNDD